MTKETQTALLKQQAVCRLTRTDLAKELGLSRETVQNVLDKGTPFVVNGKTYTAVNAWLINKLDN